MDYLKVDCKDGFIRILKEDNYGVSLQFVTQKANGQFLDSEDIEEFSFTVDEFEDLVSKMIKIRDLK